MLPVRGSAGAAGYDLSSSASLVVPARGRALVPTELCLGLPAGTYGRLAPRSGLAWRHGIDVGAGVVDSDYTGHVSVVLFNHGDADFSIAAGDRIAQLVLERIALPDVQETDSIQATHRAEAGFGSTGVSARQAQDKEKERERLQGTSAPAEQDERH